MSVNYKKVYAIKKKNEQRLLELNPDLNCRSGIYFFTRKNEDGFSFAYVGQAVNIKERCISHMTGYSHIDLSIKKRGLYSKDNPCGWKLGFLNFPKDQLDEKEKYYIKTYAMNGYQLLNASAGGQGKGKNQLSDYKPPKTYQEGLVRGYKNASKEVSHLFDLHLKFSTKSENPNANQLKAIQKFQDFLDFHKQKDE